MKPSFLNHDKALLTVMLQCQDPEATIETIRKANAQGAEAYGFQVESLPFEYRTVDTYKRIFAEMQGRPVYATNYRLTKNLGKTDDELVEGMLTLADGGATLCDVMGDLFCRHPEELTDDAHAIDRQMKLIDTLHNRGVEVLMSSHLFKYAPAERVLEIAFEQKRRGADIVKIVTAADNMEQQLENLRITHLLKRELGMPFLFLSGGVCALHRRANMALGSCMGLCVQEYGELSTPEQPLLGVLKIIRDEIGL